MCVLLLHAMGVVASTWPTTDHEVESPYGWREYTATFHAGWDIPAHNDDVYATDSGTVTEVYPSGAPVGSGWFGYGITVIINHGTYWASYHDLNDIDQNIVVDAQVTGGQIVGTAGHLHFNYFDSDGPVTGDHDENSLHPGRLLGDIGTDEFFVRSNSVPFCQLGVTTIVPSQKSILNKEIR